MSAQALPYQPGAILHDAIVGAFKARGLSFEAWCAENSVVPSAARNAILCDGSGSGTRGQSCWSLILMGGVRPFVAVVTDDRSPPTYDEISRRQYQGR